MGRTWTFFEAAKSFSFEAWKAIDKKLSNIGQTIFDNARLKARLDELSHRLFPLELLDAFVAGLGNTETSPQDRHSWNYAPKWPFSKGATNSFWRIKPLKPHCWGIKVTSNKQMNNTIMLWFHSACGKVLSKQCHDTTCGGWSHGPSLVRAMSAMCQGPDSFMGDLKTTLSMKPGVAVFKHWALLKMWHDQQVGSHVENPSGCKDTLQFILPTKPLISYSPIALVLAKHKQYSPPFCRFQVASQHLLLRFFWGPSGQSREVQEP